MSLKHGIRNIQKRIKGFFKSEDYSSFPPPPDFAVRDDGFKKALLFFYDKLKKSENFAFSRWGDGEMAILKGDAIDILKKEHGEFKYDPCEESDKFYRDKMKEAFRFKAANYFIGIGCPCCVGADAFEWMKNKSEQTEAQLTWANLFVNANYDYFKKNFINGVFRERKIVLVCNARALPGDLPFSCEKVFRVSRNSWKDDYSLIDEIGRWIKQDNVKDRIFLFCAGPLSNMLVHQLYSKEPENTYIDTGSVLDTFMGLGATRDYLRGGFTSRKICTWDADLQKKKIFFCYGPAYGRKEMLKETVKYNAMYFPKAKVKIATNDNGIKGLKIRGLEVEIKKFVSNQGHQLGCLNALISSVKMALAEGEGDIIIFAHEDCRIQGIGLLTQAIDNINNGYDIVVRNWITGEYKEKHYGYDSYFVFDTVIMNYAAAKRIFEGLYIFKNKEDFKYRFAEEFFTGLIKKAIPLEKIYAIDYHHSTWHDTELGFYHIPSRIESSEWQWNKNNYNELYKRKNRNFYIVLIVSLSAFPLMGYMVFKILEYRI